MNSEVMTKKMVNGYWFLREKQSLVLVIRQVSH